MFLTDFDILEGDEDSRPEIDLKAKDRENYIPKMCSSDNDFDFSLSDNATIDRSAAIKNPEVGSVLL